MRRRSPVRLERRTADGKLAPVQTDQRNHRGYAKPIPPYVTTTTVPINATCPGTCPFKPSPGWPGGCYANTPLMKSLEEAARGMTGDQIIAEECYRIDRTYRKRVPHHQALRIHVGGDVPSRAAAVMVGESATDWVGRGGGPPWTFTHRYQQIPRDAWGYDISVLASIEKASQVAAATAQGYACAITLEYFPPGPQTFTLPGTDVKFFKCPEQAQPSKKKTCVTCRECFDDQKLFRQNRAVAFELHGNGQHIARAVLPSLVQLRVAGGSDAAA
jgi:hypothetical protein